MKVAVFSAKSYDRASLEESNRAFHHELKFFEPHLALETAALAAGFPCLCAFVNDVLDRAVLETLSRQGTRHIALRCSGFNHVDLVAAASFGMVVTRVPAYSPHAVAEHAVAMILALNRKIHRSYARVREGNFALDGLLGFDLAGKTVGVVGTGKIGEVFGKIMRGFDCAVLCSDPVVNPRCVELGMRYVPLDELFSGSDIISLHCPLLLETHHLINPKSIARMKSGVMLINTGRGALIDTRSVIQGLKSGKIGFLGMDVYEEEAELFFEDLSNRVIQDDVFTRLLTFPNVLITGHQAFFTSNALKAIAETALQNIRDVSENRPCPNQILPDRPKK